jgi:hypothetical protein
MLRVALIRADRDVGAVLSVDGDADEDHIECD